MSISTKTKKCIKCLNTKPSTSDNFYKNKKSSDGFTSVCKGCQSKLNKEYYQKNKEKLREQQIQYYKDNKESVKKATSQYYKDNRQWYKEYNRQYYIDNRENIALQSQEYYKNNVEKIAERDKKYYWGNREKIQEYQIMWYAENKDRVLRDAKEYYVNNKFKINKYNRNYYKSNNAEILKQKKGYYQDNFDYISQYSRKYAKENPDVYRKAYHIRVSRKNKLTHTLTLSEWVDILSDFNYSCAYCGITEEEHQLSTGQKLHQEHIIPLTKGGGYEVGNIIPACRRCNSSKNNQDFLDWYPNSNEYSSKREAFILEYLQELDTSDSQATQLR